MASKRKVEVADAALPVEKVCKPDVPQTESDDDDDNEPWCVSDSNDTGWYKGTTGKYGPVLAYEPCAANDLPALKKQLVKLEEWLITSWPRLGRRVEFTIEGAVLHLSAVKQWRYVAAKRLSWIVIEAIGIRACYRRQGHCTALFKLVERSARSIGVGVFVECVLDTDDVDGSAWTLAGWLRGRGYTRDGLDSSWYRK